MGGQGVSVIPAIGFDGPIAISVIEGSVQRRGVEKFLKFKVVCIPIHLSWGNEISSD